MRYSSWLWICCWVLKLSLGLGMGLTTLSAASSSSTAAHTAHPSAVHPQHPLVADPSTSTAAPLDECHGHASAQTETSHDDSVHCTAHADCHHCCPLGWGHGSHMALHPVPTLHPARPLTAWLSTSWVPDLRPPIA